MLGTGTFVHLNFFNCELIPNTFVRLREYHQAPLICAKRRMLSSRQVAFELQSERCVFGKQ